MLRLATCAACVLLLLPAVMSYQVSINTNQFPGTMMQNLPKWAEPMRNSDGVMALGALHPKDPLSDKERVNLVRLFQPKKKLFITTWDIMMGNHLQTVNYQNIDDYIYERFDGAMSGGKAGPAADIFVWDVTSPYGSGTMPVAKLDFLAKAKFRKVLLLVRGWGEDAKYQTQIKQSIMHPQVSGVVIEARPESLLYSKVYGLNERLQVSKFVAATNKPFYILCPPGTLPKQPDPTRPKHLERLKAMLQSLTFVLGKEYMCSGPITIVPAAYPVGETDIEFLPTRSPAGRLMNTYAGGVQYLIEHKRMTCGGAGPIKPPSSPKPPAPAPNPKGNPKTQCMKDCNARRRAACAKKCSTPACECQCRIAAFKACTSLCDVPVRKYTC